MSVLHSGLLSLGDFTYSFSLSLPGAEVFLLGTGG